jgi:hypothetical protein
MEFLAVEQRIEIEMANTKVSGGGVEFKQEDTEKKTPCLIDRIGTVVLHGSWRWSDRARDNKESNP